jgi:hypothetical protein
MEGRGGGVAQGVAGPQKVSQTPEGITIGKNSAIEANPLFFLCNSTDGAIALLYNSIDSAIVLYL